MSAKSEKIIAIIPARYGSTRFPGKPLVDIGGKSMIRHVYERTGSVVDDVYVATDDSRIIREVESFGGKAVMTSADCANGTARVAEAYSRLGLDADIIIDVQGDEPFIEPSVIASLIDEFRSKPNSEIVTLAQRFDPKEGFEALFNPNRVKMTIDSRGRVLYFSRSIIPYVRDFKWQEWIDTTEFLVHIGLYGFRSDILPELIALPQSSLEKAESLEQLRWLQNGYRIDAVVTDYSSHPIDTPEDLEKANLRQNS